MMIAFEDKQNSAVMLAIVSNFMEKRGLGIIK